MPRFTLATIADAVGGELEGDPGLEIQRVRDVEDAVEGDICVLIHRRWAGRVAELRASAVIVPTDLEAVPRNVVRVANPRQALIRVLQLFYPEERPKGSVSAAAFVSPRATLGRDVFVAAGATIEDEAVIGDRCAIHGGAHVGRGVSLGEDSVLFPNVTLYPGVRIGRRARIHAGAVIGSDGFGYDRDDSGVQHKIPHVGGVEIGDDVEIGANSAIDRATMGATHIGDGCKIDNLVQIGHNCKLGKHCCIIGLAGLSGSVTLGDCCVLAGQAGVADHVTLADNVIVGAQSGVHRDLSPGPWAGSPAIPAGEAYKVYTALSRLPEMRKTLRALEERVRTLEGTATPSKGSG